MCVHNAGRSQMAAALLDQLAGGRVHGALGGQRAGRRVNPDVVAAMAELGLDVSREFPKPLTDEAVQAADVVITMGCGDACPIYPGKRYEDWELDDPAGHGPRRRARASATRSPSASGRLADELAPRELTRRSPAGCSPSSSAPRSWPRS